MQEDKKYYYLGLVDPVIEAMARLEFEDGLRTRVLPCTLVTAAPSPGSIVHHPVRVGHGGGVVVIRTPVRPNSNSADFCEWVELHYSSYVVLG